MTSGDDGRPGWVYYGAIALFVGILAFAILGLVRSSSLVGAASHDRDSGALHPTQRPSPQSILSAGPPPTPRIPPPTASAVTPPPSRTYLHPPPEGAAIYSDPPEELRR